MQEEHNIPLIDLDIVAREVVEPGTSTLKQLVQAFGQEVLQPDGTLDRPKLGRIAFGDESKRKILNKITHAAVRRRMAWLLIKYWMSGAKVVVVDTPLLVEAGLWQWCGQAVVVWCSKEDQLIRMLKRDSDKGLTEEDAKQRLAAQWDLDKKRPYADVILDNSKPLRAAGPSEQQDDESLESQVARLVASWNRHYSGLFGAFWWLSEWLVPPFGIVMGILVGLRRQNQVKRRLGAKDKRAHKL